MAQSVRKIQQQGPFPEIMDAAKLANVTVQLRTLSYDGRSLVVRKKILHETAPTRSVDYRE